MKLFESSVFQFGILLLSIMALIAGFTDDIDWKYWSENALEIFLIYAGKEGVVYASTAYKDKVNAA